MLLFDRRSRQAQLTAAGEELLNEGRRLLAEMDAVAQRVRRVSTGWETELTIAADDVLSRLTLLELCEAFYALRPSGDGEPGPGTRLRLRTERIYLQVGSFENPSEADNLKARLALSGIQASAQRTQLPDGRIVHRVRVGPFAKPEDMNPMRARLSDAGFNASVSRNQ
ncbi:MAG TPA: SPOR domain-containing protein [Thauera aminoaromatica]|nr:SPOR domain-containing protein [Thauera aminoaromatica]